MQTIESIIIDDILQDIVQGKYKANDQFPSENELADHYQVPRIKVRNAYLKLEDMGYIFSQQGKGRYLKPKQQQPIELHLSGNSSFSEKMKRAGYELVTENMGCEKISYDSSIYANLQVQREDEVFKISRLRIIDGQALALHISYVAKSVFPRIEVEGDQIQSMFSYYKNQGFTDFISNKSTVSVSFPTSVERSLLACASLVPLLILQSDCVDANQKNILEYTKIIYRSDSFTYVISPE